MKIVYGANYGRPTLDLNFARNKSLIDTISGQNLVTFTRSSTGTYVDSDGLIKTASANTPRFDHNPLTGECLGLLIEEQKTNNTTSSNSWGTSLAEARIIEPNTTISPDGTLNASKFVVLSGYSSGQTQVSDAYGTINNCCISIFAKLANDGWGISFREYINTGYSASFNLSNGTASATGGTTAYTISYPNGWYRCVWLYSDSNSNTSKFEFRPTGGAGDSIKGTFIYGFQIEDNTTFPTSYIPTSGSTVTRSADVASITGTNFSRWYNQSEGTIFSNFTKIDTSTNEFVIGLGYDSSNYIGIGYQGDQFVFAQPLCGILNTAGNYPNPTNRNLKTTLGYSSAGIISYLDTSFTASKTATGALPSGASGTLYFGSSPFSPSTIATSRFARFTYYPTRLQNYQLQQLTK